MARTRFSKPINQLTDFEVVAKLRSAASTKNNSCHHRREHSKWNIEAKKRGIKTWSNTSSSLNNDLNIGHIRYKDGSTYKNPRRRK